METLRRNQRTVHQGLGVLPLLGSSDSTGLLSPYFQRNEMREEAPSRDIHLSLYMTNVKAIIFGFNFGSVNISPSVLFFQDDGTVIEDASGVVGTPLSGIDDYETLKTAVQSLIASYAVTQSYTITDYIWAIAPNVPPALANAPQAAIANAPADAVTNYNTITTLLGALTGAVNTANTKQNDIATKLNSLLSELRTLGLIAT